MTRGWLVAAACGVLVGIPALASAQQDDPPATGDFQAVDDTPDPAWHANGTTAKTLTIATGGTVTFHYDGGTNKHNLYWNGDKQPASCAGIPGMYTPQGPPWSGSCRFTQPGTYAFVCIIHVNMTGTVVVEDPTQPSATPTAVPTTSPGPGATPTPGPGATPDPGGSGATPQSTLRGAVKLGSAQRGGRVRGTVSVKGAKSRLEVAVFVKRSALAGGKSHAPVRVGRWVKASAPAGKVAFAVKLTARARSALRRHRRLAVTVSVALTPPGGHKLTRSLHATLRPG